MGLKCTLLDQIQVLEGVKTSNLVLSGWNTPLDVLEGLCRVQGPYIAVKSLQGVSQKHPVRAQNGDFGRFLAF